MVLQIEQQIYPSIDIDVDVALGRTETIVGDNRALGSRWLACLQAIITDSDIDVYLGLENK